MSISRLPSKYPPKAHGEIVLRGRTICPGIAFGQAQIVDSEIPSAKINIVPSQVKKEQERYSRAVATVSRHLQRHIEEAHSGSWLSASQILKVHRVILEDRGIHKSVKDRIASELKNAEWAVVNEAEFIIGRLEATRDAYFQARAEDIRDLAGNILEALTQPRDEQESSAECSARRPVIVSGNLYPSAAIQAQRSCATGFVTESRALASHAAILLKAFGIPAVGGVRGLRTAVGKDDVVIVDAMRGEVVIRPRPVTLRKYRALKKEATPR